MNEKTFRTLMETGAVKKVHIVGQGARFHVEAKTPNGSLTAMTLRGDIKSWTSLDATARWVRSLGVGTVQVSLGNWRPEQRSLGL